MKNLKRSGPLWCQKRAVVLSLCALFLSTSPASAARDKLRLRNESIPMPGAPAQVLATDMTGDGRNDLVIAVAYTEWDQIEFSEVTEMEDIAGLVEVLTIVPSLFDRRELWVYEALPGGDYQAVGGSELPKSVLSLEVGPSLAHPLLAFTDTGVSSLQLAPEPENRDDLEERDDSSHLPARGFAWTELYAKRHVASKTGTFLPGIELLADLDRDGEQDDLLFPGEQGLDVVLDIAPGAAASATLRYPPEDPDDVEIATRNYPLPKIEDLNGDGQLDLLLEFPHWNTRANRFFAFLNRGAGRFDGPIFPFSEWQEALDAHNDAVDAAEEAAEDEDYEPPEPPYYALEHFGDLDGDGRAEAVTAQSLDTAEGGFRKEMKEAKNPSIRYAVYRTGEDLSIDEKPHEQFDTYGYAFGGDASVQLPGGLQDLDGDGRLDLVSITLDFSLFQAVRVLTSQSIKIGMDFNVYCRNERGKMAPVEATDLSGVFRLDLNDLRLGRLAQFAGDFDGDGRPDFVQMGRGKSVGIHRGQAGCRYPEKPDLEVKLREEPLDLALLQVRDLDGDGLADLMVTQPRSAEDPDVTNPVRIDLYLSGESK